MKRNDTAKKLEKINKIDFSKNFKKKRTSIEERPTIPYAKVFKNAKDKDRSRQARKKAERDAFSKWE